MTKELLLNQQSANFDMTMPGDSSLRYGVDYDFIVESFNCEYKLDVKQLTDIQTNYTQTSDPGTRNELLNSFLELYPECPTKVIEKVEIPSTIIKKAYFVQSPKQANGLPAVDYSLKARMLSDFRAKRSAVKKLMAQCEEAHDKIGTVRYNAKQLAIKVVCNSEYGASNNMVFAHYDSDIAAGVTYASRSLIKFLTQVIESDILYVDEKFLKDNQKQIDMLKFIGCLTIEKLASQPDLNKNRRRCLRRLLTDSLEHRPVDVYAIHIKPATVCYQDTDSNYYRNDYITDYYTTTKYAACPVKYPDGSLLDVPEVDPETGLRCSPELIDECMHMMLAHNELIANFAQHSIARRPYALGFEGAFIVCRYLNRKKKYYGVKWGDDSELRLGYKLSPDAYVSGFLRDDYDQWWQPKKTVIPQSNGEYIRLDFNKLLKERVNYLDYIRSQNVKCTGVDLARRDQYKFINFFHCQTLQKDLRLMSYKGSGQWYVFPRDTPMTDVIDEIVQTYQASLNDINNIAMSWGREDKLSVEFLPGTLRFTLLDFAKSAQYKPGSHNDLLPIITRLRAQHLEKYIANPGERMNYAVLLDDATKAERLAGKKAMANSGARSYVIDEILDQIHEAYPESEFKLENLSYDEWVDAKAISMLDPVYYLTALCKAMALYLVGDYFPEDIQAIDNGLIPPAKANELISKFQDQIAKTYVEHFFHSSTSIKREIRDGQKQLDLPVLLKGEPAQLVREVVSGLESVELTRDVIVSILPEVSTQFEAAKKVFEDMLAVLKHIKTNEFSPLVSKDVDQLKIYDRYSAEDFQSFSRDYAIVHARYQKLHTVHHFLIESLNQSDD